MGVKVGMPSDLLHMVMPMVKYVAMPSSDTHSCIL